VRNKRGIVLCRHCEGLNVLVALYFAVVILIAPIGGVVSAAEKGELSRD
jgi:hypothetical protein